MRNVYVCVCGREKVTLSLTCCLPYFRQSSSYYGLSSLLMQKQFLGLANPCRIKVCQEWFSVCVMNRFFSAYFPLLFHLHRTDCLDAVYFFIFIYVFIFCFHRRCRTCLFSCKILLDFTFAGKHWRHGWNIKKSMSENLQISPLSSSRKHEHAHSLQIRSLYQVPCLNLEPLFKPLVLCRVAGRETLLMDGRSITGVAHTHTHTYAQFTVSN